MILRIVAHNRLRDGSLERFRWLGCQAQWDADVRRCVTRMRGKAWMRCVSTKPRLPKPKLAEPGIQILCWDSWVFDVRRGVSQWGMVWLGREAPLTRPAMRGVASLKRVSTKPGLQSPKLIKLGIWKLTLDGYTGTAASLGCEALLDSDARRRVTQMRGAAWFGCWAPCD